MHSLYNHKAGNDSLWVQGIMSYLLLSNILGVGDFWHHFSAIYCMNLGARCIHTHAFLHKYFRWTTQVGINISTVNGWPRLFQF